METPDLLKPGALFRARGRDYHLERRQGDLLFARAVDTEEEALFYLPLEAPGLRLTALGLPPPEPGDMALHDLLLRALELSTLHADAPFLALQRSRVVPANYQLVPLLMALRQPQVRLLIADDVGLGKTIEAGLILKELLLRGKARRVLLLAPAHLLAQWQEALRRFFHLEFEILSGSNLKRLARTLPPGANPWTHFDRVIASVDYAKGDGVRHLVLMQDWDLLLLDEAHLAARPPTERGSQMERYRLVRDLALRVPHLLLLTATPHNGYTESFHSLLEHLDAGRLGLFKGGRLDREAAKKHVVQRRRRDVEEWFRKWPTCASRPTATWTATWTGPARLSWPSLPPWDSPCGLLPLQRGWLVGQGIARWGSKRLVPEGMGGVWPRDAAGNFLGFVHFFTILPAGEKYLPRWDEGGLEAQTPLPVRPVEKTLLAELDLPSPWGLAAWDPQTLLTTREGQALKLTLSAPLW